MTSHICIFCCIPFTRKDNLNRHLKDKSCPVAKTMTHLDFHNMINISNISEIQKQQNINEHAIREKYEQIDQEEQDQFTGINFQEVLKDSQYIYILQEREFIKTNEPIYKIGKTTKGAFHRFGQYPKGSKLKFLIQVNNCHTKETDILNTLSTLYKKRSDIGNEYYECNIECLIKTVCYICLQ